MVSVSSFKKKTNTNGKVRRVSNAFSFFGFSLKSNLITRLALLKNFTGDKIRFTKNISALSADVVAMFMQNTVDSKVGPFLRYLWFDKGKNETYQNTSQFIGAADSHLRKCVEKVIHIYATKSSSDYVGYCLLFNLE